MNPRAVVVVAALGVACALPASASAEVRISFAGGRVTINASNATIGEIFQEWARVGGSRFVNAERLSASDRLTLTIENESETRAIATLLRSSGGYFIVPSDGASSASVVKAVYILSATRGAVATSESPAPIYTPPQPEANAYVAPGPPRPDDDGPVRREVPPAPAPQAPAGVQSNPGMPATPASGATTRTVPGLGVTSSQPGVVINPPATTNGRGQRPTVTPTRPGGRSGGGGSGPRR